MDGPGSGDGAPRGTGWILGAVWHFSGSGLAKTARCGPELKHARGARGRERPPGFLGQEPPYACHAPALRAQPTHSVVTSRAASRLHSLLPWPQNGPGALRLRDQVIQPVHPAHRRCERGSGRPAARCAALTIRPPDNRLPLICSLKHGFIAAAPRPDEAPGRMPTVGGAGADMSLGGCM